MNQPTLPWWNREYHSDRRPILLARNRIAEAIRAYFARAGFIDVDPALLQISPGNETHIHGLAASVRRPDGSVHQRYLHSSPEFALKKLLAAGEQRIFSLGHVFRDREQGPLHSTEFTMVEWYRAGETYDSVMEDGIALLRAAASAVGKEWLQWRGLRVDASLQPSKISVQQAFLSHANVDVLATIRPDNSVDRNALAAAAVKCGVTCAADDTWSDIFSRVLVAKVEPHLGQESITVLDRYPATEAALARLCSDDGRVAERFEIYACGVELANGFGELTDAEEQRRRFEHEMSEKYRLYGERYPIDEEFLSALQSMPPASGCALGFDRLVMLATGASSIQQVIWTPSS